MNEMKCTTTTTSMGEGRGITHFCVDIKDGETEDLSWRLAGHVVSILMSLCTVCGTFKSLHFLVDRQCNADITFRSDRKVI